MKRRPSSEQTEADRKITELRARLCEAEEVLRALRNGEADALVIDGPRGQQIYTLESADHPYRLFVEKMHEGALTLGVDDTILYCNRRFSEMVAKPLDELVGANFTQFIPPTEVQKYAATRDQARQHAVKAECALLTTESKLVPAYLSFCPLPTEDGRCCVVVTDLTQQEHSKEIIAAKEAAEAANRAKDRFLAILSHELRTPLTPVVVTVAALEQNADLPQSVREDLAMVRRNIELEAKLIDDLLDMSRVISGKLSLRLEPVSLHAILKSAAGICQNDVAAKRIVLRSELEARQDHVRADGARLQQVFWNLIKNAIKFTPDGGQITIRTSQDGQGSVRVEIQDTGIGIEPDLLPRIFDAFEQGDSRITRHFGGLGLGLAISKALVDLHQGTIEVNSAGRGRGSRFTVTLALADGDPPSTAQAVASEHDANDREAPLRILLVDDHTDTVRMLSRLLSRSGYSVRSASSVAAALEIAGSEAFDLVISDLGLPDASGYELMEQIRERQDVIGIAISGYGMDEDLRRSQQAGFAEHLIKPVSVQQLEKVIQRVVGDGRGTVPSRAE